MRQSIIIVSLGLMALLTLLAGYRITKQDKLLIEYKTMIDELIKRQTVSQNNIAILYKYMIKHEASIKLLENGAFK